MTPDRQAVARLAVRLAKLLNGLPTHEARRRAHDYGSIAHEELLGVGFTPDEATAIIDGVLVDVIRRLALGDRKAI